MARGLFVANYHFTIIIHYVLAITVINQLCKQSAIRRGRAGCGDVGGCNLSFRSLGVSSDGKANWVFMTFTLGSLTRGIYSRETQKSDPPQVCQC